MTAKIMKIDRLVGSFLSSSISSEIVAFLSRVLTTGKILTDDQIL